MESAGDEEETGVFGSWEFVEPRERTKWEKYLGDPSMPRLTVSMRKTVKDWQPAEQPRPWNLNFGNVLNKDERKPFSAQLEGKEKYCVQVDINSFMMFLK